METLRAPFPWFGGKSRAASLIWERFGNVPNYVEPFAGSLATLLARPHAPRIETVNDRDAHLANFWRALKHDPAGVARWADWPVNEVDLHARHAWLVNEGKPIVDRLLTDPEFYDVKIAGWWVWGICMWIGSGWCTRPDRKGRANAGRAARGVHAQRLHHKRPALDCAGRGIHALSRQIPHLRGNRGAVGQGIHASAFERKTGGVPSCFEALAERLRRVRVCCGDWSRVVTPSVTTIIGMTGVLLDPPYAGETGRDADIYAEDDLQIAHRVREWAIAHGDNPKLRIALCGLEGEHEMPDSWEVTTWRSPSGYGRARRERIWFSPHCLKPERVIQLGLAAD